VEAEDEKEGEDGEDWDNKDVNEDGERLEEVIEDPEKGNDEGGEDDCKEVN
jgi:hypothetical protein